MAVEVKRASKIQSPGRAIDKTTALHFPPGKAEMRCHWSRPNGCPSPVRHGLSTKYVDAQARAFPRGWLLPR
ncbi:hypothetical protein GCM10007897_20330 [Sphingobium jiangsuense]|nr:hypothetical protein GCM10007897_20330 [Sphingobium jiangsuense]